MDAQKVFRVFPAAISVLLEKKSGVQLKFLCVSERFAQSME
jgi:hypothetical protein